MDPEQLDALKQRYEFDAWRNINRLDRELVIQHITLPKDLIKGLDPERARDIDPGDGTRLLRVSWYEPGHEESALLFMDIRECESLQAAHDILLELLANMQAPDVERLADSALGDVAFARETVTAVIFARGNIAVSIWNGGEKVLSVSDVANSIDEWLMKIPVRPPG